MNFVEWFITKRVSKNNNRCRSSCGTDWEKLSKNPSPFTTVEFREKIRELYLDGSTYGTLTECFFFSFHGTGSIDDPTRSVDEFQRTIRASGRTVDDSIVARDTPLIFSLSLSLSGVGHCCCPCVIDGPWDFVFFFFVCYSLVFLFLFLPFDKSTCSLGGIIATLFKKRRKNPKFPSCLERWTR